MPDANAAPDNLKFTDLEPATGNAQAEAVDGLLANRKKVNPKWFYDERGSELFDAITQLPEYYPTRTETALLQRHARVHGSHIASVEYASRSRLHVSTLRYYHPIGVFPPAEVDAATGYRRYSPQQLPITGVVDQLRRAGVSPDVIAELTGTPAAAQELLRRE